MEERFELPVQYDDLSRQDRRLVRLQYVQDQDNLCMWCKHDLNGSPPLEITDKEINWKLFPEGFLNYPIHLQHDHGTGFTEGAVHGYCNAVMWQYHGR